jgi:hypothetical protein
MNRYPSAMRSPNRVSGTLAAILVAIVLLLVIGGIAGSLDMSGREFTFLLVLWATGLAYVWWPRERRPVR